jgi:Zn-dependent protease
MFSYIAYINILLAIFNLLPFPPLDGSHILFTFLPPRFENLKIFLSQFGILLLFFILSFFSPWLFLFIKWIFSLIVGAPLL